MTVNNISSIFEWVLTESSLSQLNLDQIKLTPAKTR